jgi:hypothetical protein
VRKGDAWLGFLSARQSRLLTLLAAILAAATLGAMAPADAQTGGYRSADRKKPAQRVATGPVLAVVSLARQRIWVHDATGLIAQSAVSTGQAGHATPTGVFSVVQKKRFHRSNIYSAAPMPYMQRITWSGIALHAGVVPGYPASHGCIRLPQQFAVELWGITRIGARVVIVPDDAPVRDIAHAGLPVPAMTPAPADASLSRHQADRADNVVEIVHKDTPAPTVALVNPLERAKAAGRQAIADAASTSKAAKAAVATSAARSAEANAAIVARIGAELALATAHTKRDAAAKAMDEAADAKAIERARDTLLQAEAKITEAERTVDQARAVEATKTPEAFAAAKTAWTAERAGDEAAARLKSTERNTEPISIFVSRKAGRIFVRQAWVPIHEAPVTFKESELPLGTHTYLAAASDAAGARLRWISVSLPPSRPLQPRGETRRDGQATPASLSAAPAAHQPETAASVLERFELAEETRRFIEDRLWTGASLIVSDEGISPETGATTDFIVVTR